MPTDADDIDYMPIEFGTSTWMKFNRHHAEITFSVDIYKAIDFDINMIWDRIEDPPPDANDVTPEEDDLRIVLGLGIEF